MRRAGEGWSFVVAAGVVGCASPPSVEPGTVQVESIVLATGTASEGVVAPSASAAASAVVAPPARLAVRASTPGVVQCENIDCNAASEVCCVLPTADGKYVGHCAAKPNGDVTQSPCCDPNNPHFCGSARGVTIDRRCDEATDCGSNQRCCSFGAGEGDLITESCGDFCLEERCLPGSTCANGNRCGADPGALAGLCPLQIKPAKCGATTCAMGEACCWDATQGKGRCSVDCQGGATFACTSPEQCAPYQCNTWASLDAERYVCGGEGFIAGVLCRTLADCPTNISALGYGPPAPRATACVHAKEHPPGVKSCVYQ